MKILLLSARKRAFEMCVCVWMFAWIIYWIWICLRKRFSVNIPLQMNHPSCCWWTDWQKTAAVREQLWRAAVCTEGCAVHLFSLGLICANQRPREPLLALDLTLTAQISIRWIPHHVAQCSVYVHVYVCVSVSRADYCCCHGALEKLSERGPAFEKCSPYVAWEETDSLGGWSPFASSV